MEAGRTVSGGIMHGSQEALGMLSPMDGAADKLLKGDLGGAGNEAMLEAFGGRVFKAAGKGMAAVKRHAGQLDEAVGALSHADDAATATATGVRESIEEASSVLAKEGGGVAKTAPGKSLLPGEGAVGTYDDLIAAGSKGDNITPHHIPSANHRAQHGVSKGDGIAINMEQPFPGSGGRHRATFTYGTQADLNLTSRQALGQGIWDARRIYQQDGLYGPGIRSSLQDVIRQNRAANPGLFDK
jgi:hypothetical protein